MSQCSITRCNRGGCVELPGKGKQNIRCLLHFYASAAATEDATVGGGGIRVVDKLELRRQKVEASDKVRDLVLEIAEDIEREIQREQERLGTLEQKQNKKDAERKRPRDKSRTEDFAGTGKKHERSKEDVLMERKKKKVAAMLASKETHKINNPFAPINNPFAKQHPIAESLSSGDEEESLYVKQLKFLHEKEKRNKNSTSSTSRPTPEKHTSSTTLTPQSVPPTKRDRIELTGDELEGLEGVPEEAWRKACAGRFAGALLIGLDASNKTRCGQAGLSLENALYDFELSLSRLQQPAPAGAVGIDVEHTRGGRLIVSSFASIEAQEVERETSTLQPKASGGAFEQLKKRMSSSSSSSAGPEQRQRAAYTTHARSLLRNLRHKDNAKLRRMILGGSLSPHAVVEAAPEALMNPSSAQEWMDTKSNMFEQLKVVAVQDAVASRTQVDSLECPRCKNKKDNVIVCMVRHHESSKADIWGNKEDRSDEKEKFECAACRYTWTRFDMTL